MRNIDDYKSSWHNCKLFAPDGKCIGVCSKSRYDWYIKNNLAEEIAEKSIKLKFEPNYRNLNAPLRIVIKETRCVVCGIKDKLKKFHIIPSAYKKFFPLERKSHVSNDIVLLCEEHSQDANQLVNIYHNLLKEQYKIDESDFIDTEKSKIKGACISFLKCMKRNASSDFEYIKSIIPEKIHNIIKSTLGEHFTLNQIKEYAEIDVSKQINNCSSSYEYISKKATEENITEFIMNWKEMFVENMEPKFIDDDYYDDTIGYV